MGFSVVKIFITGGWLLRKKSHTEVQKKRWARWTSQTWIFLTAIWSKETLRNAIHCSTINSLLEGCGKRRVCGVEDGMKFRSGKTSTDPSVLRLFRVLFSQYSSRFHHTLPSVLQTEYALAYLLHQNPRNREALSRLSKTKLQIFLVTIEQTTGIVSTIQCSEEDHTSFSH